MDILIIRENIYICCMIFFPLRKKQGGDLLIMIHANLAIILI